MSIAWTEHPVLVTAARHGLGATVAPIRLQASATDDVFFRARFDRLTGFLATAVLDGVITTQDESVTSVLWQQWHDELLLSVRLEALAVRTAEFLDEAGITWLLTKGAALAHIDYPDPAARTFGDLDLVIHPNDWSAAFGVLTAGGYRREAATLPGDYDARYGKGATLTTPDGLEIDLHRRFAVGRFGVTARMEEVFDSADGFPLAGRTMPALNPAGRLLHACFHAALGGFRGLRAFRDVAQLLLVTGADWQTTFSLAQAWGAEAVVASAIQEAWSRLRLDIDHPAHDHAAATPIARRDQRVLDMFARGASFRSQALSAVPRLPAHEVPRYLWSLGAPKFRRSS